MLVLCDDSHRDQIQQPFRSPDLDVELGKVVLPGALPADQQHHHEHSPRHHHYQRRDQAEPFYCGLDLGSHLQHGGFDVFYHLVVFQHLRHRYALRHSGWVL